MKFQPLVVALAATVAIGLGHGTDGRPAWMGSALAQVKVSAEVGKHLRDVQGLLKGGKYAEALNKLRDAEAVGSRTADENALIERMRFAGAQGAGQPDTMVRAFETLKGSGRLSGAENLQYMEAIAGTFARANQHAKALNWTQRYFADGGNSAGMRQLQTASQFNSGDMGAIIKQTQAEILAAEKAGQAPARDKINLLLSAAARAKDGNAEAFGIERMLNHYPSREYWADAISRTQTRKGFADRYNLDILRLRLATGTLRNAGDYMELAQLSAGTGFADEGAKVVEAGFAAGVLGQGQDAARHQRLKDFMAGKVKESQAGFNAARVEAESRKDGNALIPLGLRLAQSGDPKGGAAMIEAGIAKGQLKREDDAKLYLGLAYFLGGDTAKAQAAWRAVKSSDGAADIARLWVVHSRQAKR